MQFSLFDIPSKKNFKIYRSSAGSGKTYTLTREYLTLALQNPQYFKTILAVTFTNKATQEMKTRIVETLYQLSKGESIPIAEELEAATGFKGKRLQEQSRLVLSAILHDYSRFAVSTIDSFFQSVIRAFSKEIGLRAGFKVELDQEKVLNDLIDLVLKDVGLNKHLTEWLTQYAADRVDEGYTWDIRQDIKKLAGEIFKEDFKRSEKALQKVAEEGGQFMHFLKQLKELREDFEKQMQTIAEDALKLMEDYGLQVEDFSYGQSGVAGYFTNLLPDKKKYQPGTRAISGLHDASKWYSKSSKKKDAIEAAVLNGLDQQLQKAIELYDRDYLKYNTAKQVLRFVYSFGILASLSAKLRHYREDNDLMLISDASVFLKEIIKENDAPFIYEKTGTSFQHFLIDEFQDTSGFQWENFKPLVANSVASGNYNLVVGDIKQSIYRWRGGDWQLLLNKVMQDIGPVQTELIPLNQNWRSCREVIDFNNSLFFKAAHEVKQFCIEQISEIGDETEEAVLSFEAENVAKAYADVYQLFPAIKESSNRCGYINIQFIEETKEKEEEEEATGWKVQAQQNMIKTIELLQDKGYRLKDIALLVRTKGEGKELADALMAADENKAPGSPYNYTVISNESLFVNSAASVCLLLNILRYMNNQNDIVARANMVFDYQKYVLNNEEIDLHYLFRSSGAKENKYEQFLPENFIEKRPYLNKLPLYELVETLVLEFKLNKIKGEWAYLQAFQDAVLNFTKTERGDIDSFLSWWQESGKDLSVQISESLNAIRIYTIHKSKGLQFKAVVMPYCTWRLDHNTQFNNFIWTNTEIKPFNKVEVLPVKYTANLKETIFRQAYYREQMRAYMDNLNLLYVAFTRAENCLFACSPMPVINKKTGLAKANEVNGLLHRLLTGQQSANLEDEREPFSYIQLAPYWQEESNSYELGQLEPIVSKEEVTDTRQMELEYYLTNRWRKKLTVRQRSGSLTYAKDETMASELNWNQTIHALLARIKTKGDLSKALDEVYFEGLISKTEQKAIKQQLEKYFNDPVIGRWFGPDWEVRTELPILSKGGFVTRPDRIITKDGKAIVIDFKLDGVKEEHKRQVKRYVQLLQRMHFKEVKGYLLYLDEEKLIEVV